jgi:predicted dithiol-disulfide oxidoreductase (DUF899 family)
MRTQGTTHAFAPGHALPGCMANLNKIKGTDVPLQSTRAALARAVRSPLSLRMSEEGGNADKEMEELMKKRVELLKEKEELIRERQIIATQKKQGPVPEVQRPKEPASGVHASR